MYNLVLLPSLMKDKINLVLVTLSLLMKVKAQLGQYELDINSKSSEGIFVTYYQISVISCHNQQY